MKQKILINVSMHDEKSRAKAMRITAVLSGVESVALKGDDKKQIEVTGEDVDIIRLTSLLRKKIGHAELVSVSKVEPPKPDEDKKTDGDKKPELLYVSGWPHGYSYGMPYNHGQVWVRVPDYYREPNCNIL